MDDMPDDTSIERSTFEDLQESAGAEFVVELIDTFLEEAPTMLSELREALAVGNADAFRRAAHSLKSNGNTFGALRLGELARGLELGGLDSARAAGPDALAALEGEYLRVAAALTELRDA
jgi:HPt (histidine-containing phosphotransfer) domain-containing protein